MPLDHHTQATAGQPVTKHGLRNPHPSNPYLHHRHDRPPHRNTQREEETKGTTAAPARERRPPSSSRNHQCPIPRSQKSPLPSRGAEPGTQPDLPHGQQSASPGQSLGPPSPVPRIAAWSTAHRAAPNDHRAQFSGRHYTRSTQAKPIDHRAHDLAWPISRLPLRQAHDPPRPILRMAARSPRIKKSPGTTWHQGS